MHVGRVGAETRIRMGELSGLIQVEGRMRTPRQEAEARRGVSSWRARQGAVTQSHPATPLASLHGSEGM